MRVENPGPLERRTPLAGCCSDSLAVKTGITPGSRPYDGRRGTIDTRLLDLASILHHFVGAENMAKDVVVREAAQAVATGKHLSDGKTVRPAAKIVIPNTGHRSDCQPYRGIAELTFQRLPVPLGQSTPECESIVRRESVAVSAPM